MHSTPCCNDNAGRLCHKPALSRIEQVLVLEELIHLFLGQA